MAKWHCRTSDRHAAPRIPGSGHCVRRGAIAPCALCLCGILQSNASASGFTEGYPLKARHPTDRQRCGHPDPWRITSPIRPDMIFGKDTRAATADGGQAVTRRCTREVLMRLKARDKIEAARISG